RFRKHRQIFKFPLFVLIIVTFRICQCDQVAECPSHYVLIPFNISIPFSMTLQHTCNITCNRRFFSQYYAFRQYYHPFAYSDSIHHLYQRENAGDRRSEEHTSELQSRFDLVCRLLLEKKKRNELKSTENNSTQIYLNLYPHVHHHSHP